MLTMGNLSRMLLLFGLASSPVRAQQYENQNMPPPDPYAQQQQDPYAQQPQQDPYAQQPQDPNAQYDPNAQPQYDPNYAPQQQVYEYAFYGTHPVPYDQGGGYCYQQGPHYHQYAPFDQNLFRQANGYFYFIGDPADFGYTQQLWGYNGNHPIPLGWGGGYCYISWPHRHPYAPASAAYYNFVGGYYVYGGPWDPWYWRMRPRYQAYYGGYYRHSYYGGIYWRTRPAPIYRPRIVVGAPGYYRPGAVVVAPGRGRVVVGAPHPGYRPGGVVVGAPRPGYVGPPRPAGGVYVGAPRPAGGVVVGAPRPYAPAPRPGGVGVGAPRPYAPAPRPVGPPPGHAMGAPPAHVGAPPAHVGGGAPPARGGGGGGHHR